MFIFFIYLLLYAFYTEAVK